MEEIGNARHDKEEPDHRFDLKKAEQRKRDDPGKAAAGNEGVTDDAVGIGVEGFAQSLAQANEHERDEHEESSGDQIDWDRESRDVGDLVLRSEENLLWRSRMAGTDGQPLPT